MFNFVSTQDDDDTTVVQPSEDEIVPGDIVEVATKWLKPVSKCNKDYDDTAQLRVLAFGRDDDDSVLYVMLVTDADVKHIWPTTRVSIQIARDYGIEKRFVGDDAIFIPKSHVRSIIKQQRGRWCEKCDEYNEDVRIEYTEVYYCLTCRENPWR